MGIQASGKSTFFREKFFDSHVRLNLDMLKTRHRESILFEACLNGKASFVIDNTNPTKKDRQRYIPRIKQEGFRLVGYYFQSKIQECLERNDRREDAARIPEAGVFTAYRLMELPAFDEGFDELYYVSITNDGRFNVVEWVDEV